MAKRTVYSGAGSNVAKEAYAKKLGGSVYSGAGSNVVKEAKEKKRGGALSMDDGKKVKKARGGSVGSDKSPFSSAGGGSASTSPFSSACRR